MTTKKEFNKVLSEVRKSVSSIDVFRNAFYLSENDRINGIKINIEFLESLLLDLKKFDIEKILVNHR